MTDKLWAFDEPHDTGGNSHVTITEKQIIEFMNTQGIVRKGRSLTDKEIVDEFVVVNWCYLEPKGQH